MKSAAFGIRASAIALWVLAALLSVAGARAQDDGVDARREEARKLADSAFDLMTKGLCDEAIGLFLKADARFHSPVFLVYASQCQDKLGELVAARKLLASVTQEKLAEHAPDSFRKAQDDARAQLAALDKRIPLVTITLHGARPESVSVSLDGKPVASSELATPIRVDPGRHAVRGAGAGGQVKDRSFEAKEGDRLAVDLTFDALAGPSQRPPPSPQPDGGPEAGGEGSYIPAAVAFAVGGAGGVMAAVAGGLFLSRAGDLKDACESDGDDDPNTCPDGDEIEAVSLLGNLATAGWVIAGVGTVTGLVLLFVPLGGDDEAPVSLRVSPTSLAVGGRF
jgi:hypothetical protein